MSKLNLASALRSVVNRIIRVGGKFQEIEVYTRETKPNMLGVSGTWELYRPPETVLVLESRNGSRNVSIGFPENIITKQSDIIAIWSGELNLPGECQLRINGKCYRVTGTRHPRLNREVFITIVFAVSEVV